jgi:hypothetical protein
MTAAEFIPESSFEESLCAAQAGKIRTDELIREFLENDVAVPSSTEVLADGSGMSPVFYDKDGVSMAAVFTSLERAKRVSSIATYCLQINVKQLLHRMPSDVGLVINSGYTVGFDISPSGIREILGEFRD